MNTAVCPLFLGRFRSLLRHTSLFGGICAAEVQLERFESHDIIPMSLQQRIHFCTLHPPRWVNLHHFHHDILQLSTIGYFRLLLFRVKFILMPESQQSVELQMI